MSENICFKCLFHDVCQFAKLHSNPKISACYHYKKRKQTNADRIRAMTDEELAEVLRDSKCNTCAWQGNDCDYADECKAERLEWLKQVSK